MNFNVIKYNVRFLDDDKTVRTGLTAEDLQPYIPSKVLLRKWFGTIFVYPLFAAIIAGIMTLI